MKYDDTLDPDFIDDMNFDEELVGEDKSKEGHKGGRVEKAKDNKDKPNEPKNRPKKEDRMGEDPKNPLTEDEDIDSGFEIYDEE